MISGNDPTQVMRPSNPNVDTCPACGHVMGHRAMVCPNCGQPSPAFEKQRKANDGMARGLFLALAIGFIVIGLLAYLTAGPLTRFVSF